MGPDHLPGPTRHRFAASRFERRRDPSTTRRTRITQRPPTGLQKRMKCNRFSGKMWPAFSEMFISFHFSKFEIEFVKHLSSMWPIFYHIWQMSI